VEFSLGQAYSEWGVSGLAYMIDEGMERGKRMEDTCTGGWGLYIRYAFEIGNFNIMLFYYYDIDLDIVQTLGCSFEILL
jgi:hypothetical protein